MPDTEKTNMSKPNYRHRARARLAGAKERLGRTPPDVEGCALELRMAMEALTYERALRYAEDLGPEAMKTWQPRKLMGHLIDVDPNADREGELHFGLEPSLGEQPKTMTNMGKESILTLRDIKKHYDALGSYLHTPTIGALETKGDHDLDRLRQRCDHIIARIEEVLASPIWSVDLKNTATIECMGCSTKLTRRMRTDDESKTVECWECGATYDMVPRAEGQVLFEPRQTRFTCRTKDCDHDNYLWEKEIVHGLHFNCEGCGAAHFVGLGAGLVPASQGPPS